MILLLAERYNRPIACMLLAILMAGLTPAHGRSLKERLYGLPVLPPIYHKVYEASKRIPGFSVKVEPADPVPEKKILPKATVDKDSADIGGPSQPEMSSFKSAGSDNMVNLFTGDFSYNIPLLDVGGYPVNIFYSGLQNVDEEASWVGAGWNINPGNVNRNMRGIPDDFNGEDVMTQTQVMKPNKTWGVRLGGDFELSGIKAKLPDGIDISAGVNLGVSFNNYLGPALDLGVKGGVEFTVASKTKAEKDATTALTVGLGLSANASSRYGFTLSPNVSLTASHFNETNSISNGLSLGTSYNSRSGINAIQISDQTSFNRKKTKLTFEDGKYGVKKYSSTNSFLTSTSITFSKPSYVPAIRMPVTNEAWSGHFQVGGGIFGVFASLEAEVYGQTATVEGNDRIQKKPMVGYLYYQKAKNNPQAVMDFTRLNDNEVTSNTPIISAPQYSYDVFSIQGEGTGGTIRPYRNDHGYVRDNATQSRDKSFGVGGDIGIPGHYGANFNTIKTPSSIGEWNDGNQLRTALGFKEAGAEGIGWENVYFRNPGEISVLNDAQFTKIGGADLVRFKLGGTNSSPTVTPVLERFSTAGQPLGTASMTLQDPAGRKKRTQVTTFLTSKEASEAGLDTVIRDYSRTTLLNSSNELVYTPILRVGGHRKSHHISQINVTEADGKRYVYGVPVYNLLQKDFTFSVTAETNDDLAGFQSDYPTDQSSLLNGSSNNKTDGFVQITETPPYAHSYLLSGLLSPDYVDVTGNGITEDDLGTAVKFNYSQSGNAKWRTPLTATPLANFNAGNRTETKDNKGIISYGIRESWYLHSIESKSMIAFFIVGDRKDNKGADTLTGINAADVSAKRLDRIDLYNKADLKNNGLANAKPVKSVHFLYSYNLCPNVPGNNGQSESYDQGPDINTAKGKLTLEKIYFTFNGQTKSTNKSQYAFSYGNGAENPGYEFNATDRWGNYKPKNANPDNLKNADFPYNIQKEDATSATERVQRAGAWALKKILLPSGGQLEVEYESDDYAFVQDRRAAVMMEIAGLGRENVAMSNKLYEMSWPGQGGTNAFGVKENDMVYVKVPEACTTKGEVFEKYLRKNAAGETVQLAFKLAVNMPKGVEYVNSYADIADYGFVSGSPVIWVKVKTIEGVTPLTLTAIEYLRERLPGQAYPGYDVSESAGLQQIGQMLAGMLDGLKSAFSDPLKYLRSQGLVQSIVLTRSFVRLNDPDGKKYGGGNRVRKVVMKDHWDKMTGQFGAQYGQIYDYSTTETWYGQKRVISSGVASYEPSMGGEENPFQSIVQVANKLPMGPTSYGAIEMPVLDAFFPAPVVGYSKVTVRSLNKDKAVEGKKSRSGVGKQVTEFYTAKDFPVYYSHTVIDPASDKQKHQNSFTPFFYKFAFDSRALSQGFLVATNDMHGKMRSQSSYAENDTTTRINYTENFYRNTGTRALNETFDFVFNKDGGAVRPGNMGVDIELMTDVREFKVNSSSWEVQAQVDLYPVLLPFWIPFIWPVRGESENTYRAVTTTKTISYHGVLDSVVVIDKGSQVSTKNLVYDAETGQVVVNRTNNEFDKPVYTISYPAYWAYSGMEPAYKNIDAVFTGLTFRDGQITAGIAANTLKQWVESGDELYLFNKGTVPVENCAAQLQSGKGHLLWALDKTKNTSSLTNTNPDLVFIDSAGLFYTRDNVSVKIIRSGKRNLLGATVAGITQMTNPVSGSPLKLVINSNSKVVNASALEYKEKWQTDQEVIRRLALVYNPSDCSSSEVEDCYGYRQKKINPYRKGLLGNFRSNRSMIVYSNRTESNPAVLTNLPENGFLQDFKLYWDFTGANLLPDLVSTKWVWNEQITRINAKGQELETKDALNIYTAAQYGFDKTLPVAIVNNSRLDEMANESFEDQFYKGSINAGTTSNCTSPPLKLSDLSNSSIANVSFAHSGKYVLAVNNGTASKTLPVSGAPATDFAFSYTKDTTKSLYDVGYNLNSLYTFPTGQRLNPSVLPLQYGITNGSSSDYVLHIVDEPTDDTLLGTYPNCYKSHENEIRTSQYFNVPQSGNYNISLIADCFSCSPSTYQSAQIYIQVYGPDGGLLWTDFNIATWSAKNYSKFLCKGAYRIDAVITMSYYAESPSCQLQSDQMPYVQFTFGTNIPSLGYKTLGTQNGCVYNNPIPATADMLNPIFSMPAGKKMLFSAWVKEPCGDSVNAVPCRVESYTHNKVRIQFNDGSAAVDLTPSGPIIEGWQRIEGSFTVPAGASESSLHFINTSGTTIYYDDVRLHPFDANMKSYVYDPVNLRLVAELDANNYASFYEYDEEGGLIRTKAETKEGIKTIQETRSFKQKALTTVQP